MGILVYLKVSHADHGVILNLFLGAPQDRADARYDLFQAERFGYIIIAADCKAHNLILRIITGGEEQHRCLHALLADTAGYCKTVNIREHNVQYYNVGIGLSNDINGFCTV